jgi:hypothetical protein
MAKNPRKRSGVRRKFEGPNRLPTIPWTSDITPSTAESAIAPSALATGLDVKRRASEIFTDAEVRVDAFSTSMDLREVDQ